MTSYIIAGSSDKKELTTCENIARQIKSIYSNIEFNFILKHPSEWEEAVKLLCKHYGLKSASNPIIFAKTGRPVGTIDDFIKLAEEKFGIDVNSLTNPMDPVVNEKIAKDDYDERHRDRTLLEKIEHKYQILLNKDKISKLKGYYESQIDKGVEYFVKKTDALAPRINVPLTDPYKYQKDPEYEDFEADFTEGMMIADAEKGPGSMSGVGNDSGRPGSSGLVKQGSLQKQNSLQRSGTLKKSSILQKQASISKPLASETSGEASKHHEEEKSSILEKVMEKVLEDKLLEMDLLGDDNKEKEKSPSQVNIGEKEEGLEQDQKLPTDPNKSQLSNIEKQSGQEQPSNLIGSEEPKLERPKAPFEFVILDDFVVENLEDNYYLSFHPYPLYEGQCIIFYNGYEQYKDIFGNLETEEEIAETKALFDFSRSERKDNGKDYIENPSLVKSKLKTEDAKSFMNKEDKSIFEPLSIQDWTKVHKVVSNTDSYAFIQLLPAGKRNYRQLSNGVVSIVPRQFLLKEYQNLGITNIKADSNDKLPFEKILEKVIEPQGKMVQFDDQAVVSNFPFKHRVTLLDPKGDGLYFKQTYLNMMQKLNIDYNQEIEKYGVNVILSSKWLMIVPIGNPYMVQKTVEKTTPIYLDPLAYIGYVVLPNLHDVWPQTGKLNLEAKKMTPSQILSYCNSQ